MNMRTIAGTMICVGMLANSALAQGQQPDMEALMKGLMGAMGQGENAEPVEVINFRELKKMLPEELPDMKRVEASGEKSGAFGMVVATAKGSFKAEDGGIVTITLTDMGAMQGVAAMTKLGWAAAEIDRETEDEYERTTEYDGFKGLEQYNHKYKRGEIKVMAGDRVMVEVGGRDVSAEQLTSGITALDLKEISELKGGEAAEEEVPVAEEVPAE